MTNFLDFVDSVHPLTNEGRAYLASVIRTKDIPKGDYLLREGETCNKIGFIDKGFLKSFSTKSGRDSNIWFWFPGDMVTSTTSFFTQSPSQNYIQAISPTRYHYLTHEALEHGYKTYPETNVIARLLLQRYYVLEVG